MPLSHFNVVIDQPVGWGDMDSFQHVNNVVYFRYFENVRLEYFRRMDWFTYQAQTGIGPSLGSTQARFRRPVKYPDTLRAGGRVADIGADRFTIRYALASQSTGELVTEGDAVVVIFDYRNNRKSALPDELRRRIEALERGAQP
jgi:acyl-CoA thioester hydrolase